MESVHIGELYCKVCRRVVGIEYKTAANGKKERRCLSRLCRGEAEKGGICRLTGEKRQACGLQ